jgi:hypothetical protein
MDERTLKVRYSSSYDPTAYVFLLQCEKNKKLDLLLSRLKVSDSSNLVLCSTYLVLVPVPVVKERKAKLRGQLVWRKSPHY